MIVSPAGTYAAAIEYLRPEIVSDIERSLPCPKAVDGRHIWDYEATHTRYWGRNGAPVRVDEWWWCVYCGLTSLTNPVPVDQRPNLVVHSASEHYSYLLHGRSV